MDSIVGRNAIEAFLFDFDGTLVHQVIDFPLMNRRVQAIARDYGVDVTQFEGRYTLEFVEQVRAALAVEDAARGARYFADAHEAIIQIEVEAALRAEVFPGVSEFLQSLLDAGIKVGIVTRNCRRAVEAILARSTIPHQVLLTRDDVQRVKPDPEHLREALRWLGVSSPRVVMVGDHPMDVQAGQALGAWAIGILNDGRPADYFDAVQPDAVLRSVADLGGYLAKNVLVRKIIA